MSEESKIIPACAFGHELAIVRGYCKQCAVCEICHKALTVTEYFQAVRESDRKSVSDKEGTYLPSFCHPACFTENEKTILNSQEITIPKSLFDKLNLCRQIMMPIEIDGQVLSAKSQDVDADLRMTAFANGEIGPPPFYISDSAKLRSFEEHQEYLYLMLRKMESACAALSLVLSKGRRAIEVNLSKKDQEAFQEALHTEREKHSKKAPKATAKVEKKAVTRFDKAVASFVKILGISEDEAKEMVRKKQPELETSEETVEVG